MHKDKQTQAAQFQKFMAPPDKLEHDVFKKGQSARIWGELYKVIDSSDVIIQVISASLLPSCKAPLGSHPYSPSISHLAHC